MASITENVPKSTLIVGSALWAILAIMGGIILNTVLSVKQDQATIIANQTNDRKEVQSVREDLSRIKTNDSKQDERLAVIETKIGDRR